MVWVRELGLVALLLGRDGLSEKNRNPITPPYVFEYFKVIWCIVWTLGSRIFVKIALTIANLTSC